MRVFISVIDHGLEEALGILSSGVLPNTEKAIQDGVLAIAEKWKAYALGEAIGQSGEKVKRPTGTLARSITIKQVGTFHWIVFSLLPYASYLEDGTKEFDFKTTHPFGNKSRVSKDGTPYLIVPFRHGNPEAIFMPMPSEIYRAILKQIRDKTFKKSMVNQNKAHYSPNFLGKNILRQGYDWGSRLAGVADDFPDLENPGIYEGMYAFDTRSGREKARSSYMSFRVISAKSKDGSWIKPPTKPLKLAENAVLEVIKDLQAAILAALKLDLGVE